MEIKGKNIKEAILNLFEIRISTTWKFRRICDLFLFWLKPEQSTDGVYCFLDCLTSNKILIKMLN